jgi:capsid protein
MALLDFSRGNFSSQKAALTLADETRKGWQRLHKERLLNPVTRWKLPTFMREVGAKIPIEEAKFVWIEPGRKWLDQPRETQGHIDAVGAGVETLQDVASDMGKFWKNLENQRAAEIAYAKDLAKELSKDGEEVSWRDIIPAKEGSNADSNQEESPEGSPEVRQP